MKTESHVLRASIAVTFLVAAIGIFFGLASGSSAIVFDGVYSLLDASMTIIALLVSNLIAAYATDDHLKSRFTKKFTTGFWHLEPMVLAVNGILLMSSATYALVNAINNILQGGHLLKFDQGIFYAALVVCVAIVMALYSGRAGKRLNSDFLVLDAKAWWMSAALTGALLAAFTFGYFIQGTPLEWISPYIDPVILAGACLVIIPLPAGMVRQALADMLLVTPEDYKAHIDAIARETVETFGFSSFRSYVARVGRGRQIELFFIVPKEKALRHLEEWDAIRDRIGDAIGGEGPDRWLTIVFTTDPEWAD